MLDIIFEDLSIHRVHYMVNQALIRGISNFPIVVVNVETTDASEPNPQIRVPRISYLSGRLEYVGDMIK